MYCIILAITRCSIHEYFIKNQRRADGCHRLHFLGRFRGSRPVYPAGKGHDRRYAIAPDKISKDIGWYPETMFKDGIKLTIKWYFENEKWMKNVTSGEYQKYYNDMYK